MRHKTDHRGGSREIKPEEISQKEQLQKQRIEDRNKRNEIQKEINAVLDALGRAHTEGNVRGDHLVKILKYLITVKKETYNKTISKLSLICGIGQRYVKENYLMGLEYFGFITVIYSEKQKHWIWNGIED